MEHHSERSSNSYFVRSEERSANSKSISDVVGEVSDEREQEIRLKFCFFFLFRSLGFVFFVAVVVAVTSSCQLLCNYLYQEERNNAHYYEEVDVHVFWVVCVSMFVTMTVTMIMIMMIMAMMVVRMSCL